MKIDYSKTNHLKIVIQVGIAILAIQIVFGLLVFTLIPDWGQRGQFGDLFGACNALFSGLAFAGLIYAILLQREDLALQRSELELTRKELQRSAAAQEQSEMALRAQAHAAAQSAQLSAINFLLDHYKSEISTWRNQALMSGTPQALRFTQVQERERVLTGMLDALFDEISSPRE